MTREVTSTYLAMSNPEPEWGQAKDVLRLAMEDCGWTERGAARKCGMPVHRFRELLGGQFLYYSDAVKLAEGLSDYREGEHSYNYWLKANVGHQGEAYSIYSDRHPDRPRQEYLCTIDFLGMVGLVTTSPVAAAEEFGRTHHLHQPFTVAVALNDSTEAFQPFFVKPERQTHFYSFATAVML